MPSVPVAAARRILIIKPSSLGDVVHALPVLHVLRRRFPAAHITWLVAPYCSGLLDGLPELNELILFDRKGFAPAWRSPAAAADLLRFHRRLRDGRFDLVIDLQGLLRSGWMAWATGAPVRVGFAAAREGGWVFYTHTVPVRSPEVHAVDRYLMIAAALGCDVDAEPPRFKFPLTDADRRRVAGMFPDNKEYAVLLPATNWLTKRWPADRFESLVGPLRRRFGLASVLAGGADAAELAPRIPSAVNLAGQTTLPQLVALLEGSRLVIANDSGPMHIAAALGRPLVAIFGPTNPVRTGPYRRPDSVARVDIPCSPCYSRRCSHTSCLNWLGVEHVLAVADQQLSRAHVGAGHAPPSPLSRQGNEGEACLAPTG